MADSTIALSLTRTDDPRPVVSLARKLESVGRVEGPGYKTIPAGNGSTEYNGWTGINDGNGSAFTAQSYARFALIVDPDNELAADDPDGELGVWVKLYYTPIAGGSSTAIGVVFFARRREGAIMIPSSLAASGVAITREITKVGIFNANSEDDVTVLLVVERAPE